MRVYLRRTLDGLAASDEEAAEALLRYKVGEMYRCEIVKPRSYQHHKLVFALLALTYSNLPDRYRSIWPDARAFRRGLADAVGHHSEYVTKDGEIRKFPRSLSYDDMPDEGEFSEIAARMMAVCSELIGVAEPELAAQVEQYAAGGGAMW